MLRKLGLGLWLLAPFVACGGDDEKLPAEPGDGAADASTNPGASDATVDANATDGARLEGDAGTDPDGSPVTCAVEPCVRQLGVGGGHSCALLADGSIRCWGNNRSGQLGFGSPDGGSNEPPTAGPTPIAQLTGQVVSAGGDFRSGWADSTCVQQSTGTVCFGNNTNGMLARGDLAPPYDPSPAPALLGSVSQLAMGSGASCALLQGGSVECWGSNQFLQVEANPQFGGGPTPKPIPAATTFTQLAVGSTTACAVTHDRHVWCWGSTFGGGLGRPGNDAGAADSLPGPVVGVDDAVQVAVSLVSGCALRADGTLTSWGLYSLGRDDTSPAAAPVQMPAGVHVTQVTALSAYSGGYCALDDGGAVWCWGNNRYGGMGAGSVVDGAVVPQDVALPTQVAGLSGVVRLASGPGAGHVCALLQSGAVKCWGQNESGQLGSAPADGGLLLSTTPLDVVW